jgi:hypothetical protein
MKITIFINLIVGLYITSSGVEKFQVHNDNEHFLLNFERHTQTNTVRIKIVLGIPVYCNEAVHITENPGFQ